MGKTGSRYFNRMILKELGDERDQGKNAHSNSPVRENCRFLFGGSFCIPILESPRLEGF